MDSFLPSTSPVQTHAAISHFHSTFLQRMMMIQAVPERGKEQPRNMILTKCLNNRNKTNCLSERIEISCRAYRYLLRRMHVLFTSLSHSLTPFLSLHLSHSFSLPLSTAALSSIRCFSHNFLHQKLRSRPLPSMSSSHVTTTKGCNSQISSPTSQRTCKRQRLGHDMESVQRGRASAACGFGRITSLITPAARHLASTDALHVSITATTWSSVT